MIKNALATLDTDTNLWSQLKSIDHTLNRILSKSDDIHLTNFDRERLGELRGFLQSRVLPTNAPTPLSTEALLRDSRAFAGAPSNFRDHINNIDAFKNWNAAAKLGFEKKIQKLIQEIELFESKTEDDFFPRNAATPEFSVLKAITAELLADIEATSR